MDVTVLQRVISGDDLRFVQGTESSSSRGVLNMLSNPPLDDQEQQRRTTDSCSNDGPSGMEIDQPHPHQTTKMTNSLFQVNLVENDVPVVVAAATATADDMVVKTMTTDNIATMNKDTIVPDLSSLSSPSAGIAQGGGVGGEYPYCWTTTPGRSDTPRSSLSDLTSAPPVLELEEEEEGDNDDDPINQNTTDDEDMEDNPLQPILLPATSGTASTGATITQVDDFQGTFTIPGNDPKQDQLQPPPPPLQQQQQQQPHEHLVVQDWETTLRSSSDNTPPSDKNWDESSSVGRTGSQTSSRDWGWFEDVHAASDGGMMMGGKDSPLESHKPKATAAGHRKQSSTTHQSSHAHTGKTHPHDMDRNQYNNKNRNNDPNSNNNNHTINNNNRRKTTSSRGSTPLGLLPSQDSLLLPMMETLEPLVHHRELESDAAAMAVTAPNYVLEESLSSQRLWKYTAGQRPPQPMEERAFFEKMWAQNFARSQVEYQMPVEVLTATTPVSLNPFADINFETEHNELSHYNLEEATENKHHGQNKKPNPSDVAEAALMRKLNEPARVPVYVEETGSGRHSNRGHPLQPNQQHQNQQQHHQNQQQQQRQQQQQQRYGRNQNQQQVVRNDGGDTLTVLLKGDNVFGTTVSKSFARPSEYGGPIRGVDTVNISVASYRVVESKKHGKYAQFLVIFREGSIRDTVGVWKRYSDFDELSRKVTQAHEGCSAVIANISPLAITEEHEVEHLPNAITSWRLLKKRKRWYRCLDSGYLSLKVFLLERFLHDILFESSSPDLLRDFVGVAQPRR